MFCFIPAFTVILVLYTDFTLAGILPDQSAAIQSEGYDYSAPTNAVFSERLISPVPPSSVYQTPSVQPPVPTVRPCSASSRISNKPIISYQQYTSAPLKQKAFTLPLISNGHFPNEDNRHSNAAPMVAPGLYSAPFVTVPNKNVQVSNGGYSGQLSAW